jgi:hypothetical protein
MKILGTIVLAIGVIIGALLFFFVVVMRAGSPLNNQ